MTDSASTAPASPGAASIPAVHRRLYGRLWLLAAVIVLADILTKVWAVAGLEDREPLRLFGPVSLTLVRNPGAAFSMATSMTWILTVIAVVVAIVVARLGRSLASPWWALGLGLILGGAIGNLIDRFFRSPGIMRGHVVDFFSVGWFPVFNVADSAVTCGAVLVAALLFFGVEPSARAGTEAAEGPAAGAVGPEATGTEAAGPAPTGTEATGPAPTGTAPGAPDVAAAPGPQQTDINHTREEKGRA